MSRRMLWMVFSFLLLMPLSLMALHEGQSMAEVRAEMGEPNGRRVMSDGEKWVYSGDIVLRFVDGRLAAVTGLPFEPASGQETSGEVATISRDAPAVPGPQQPAPDRPSVPPKGASETVPAEDAVSSGIDELDEEIEQFSKSPTDPEVIESLGFDLGMDDADEAADDGWLNAAISFLGFACIQFFFLLIAFKWVGAEAAKSALFLIALVNQLVISLVEWFFLGVLGFPMTFHADQLVSVFVMLGMVTTLTHAKQLPTALKVVIASKVAAIIVVYLLAMVVLFSM